MTSATTNNTTMDSAVTDSTTLNNSITNNVRTNDPASNNMMTNNVTASSTLTKTTMMTIAETAQWLNDRDNFLIITHRRPDGDALGCAGALALGLGELGKKAYVLQNPEVTPRYEWLINDYCAPDGFTPDYTITVDTASPELFPKNFTESDGQVSLSIDHHPSNSMYAEYICLDGTCASCGEVIYSLLMELSGAINAKAAGYLYAALSTDTGCFEFANTTANTLRVAALLIDAGASNQDINRLLFRTKSLGRVKIEGLIYSGLEFYFDGTVAISTITLSMMQEVNATEDDVDDIASIPGAIDGVLVGITLREMTSTNDCKVSVRTSPTVNAHGICAKLGGGGHAMAAGCTFDTSVIEARDALLKVIPEFLPNERQK